MTAQTDHFKAWLEGEGEEPGSLFYQPKKKEAAPRHPASWASQPLDEDHTDQYCNDGGGRNGNPTLLEALFTLIGRRQTSIEDDELKQLAKAIGVKKPATVKSELRQMAARGTIGLLPITDGASVWITSAGFAQMGGTR